MARAATTVLALLAAVCVTGAGGCIRTINDGTALGGRVELPALTDTAEPGVTWADGPSLTGIDRANWAATKILVPVNGTAHSPLRLRHHHRAFTTARQRGEYPTEATALDLVEGSEARQRGEALAAPVMAMGQIVLWIPRMFLKPPTATDFSPLEHYQRYWHGVPAIQAAD